MADVKLLMNTQYCIEGAEVAMINHKQNSEQTDPSNSLLVASDSQGIAHVYLGLSPDRRRIRKP